MEGSESRATLSYTQNYETTRIGGARSLVSRGTRPAVLGNNVRWNMPLFYNLETESLRWVFSYHSNRTTKTKKNEDRARCWSCLMHTERDRAARGHTALEKAGSAEESDKG